MPNHRFILEYDGTDFEGWQRQPPGHRTVQGALEDALARVTGAFAPVAGAGRTDAGVHAEGQVASAELATRLPPEGLWQALNAVLPADLAVVGLERAEPGFHARRDAAAKVYRYRIWNGTERSPLRDRYALAVSAKLDLASVTAAAAHLRGTWDFSSFQASGSSPGSAVRTLRRLELSGSPGGEIVLEFEGNGFLRHMVRNLVGTLLEVGRGRRVPDSLPAVLAARDRAAAGPTAAARGLSLIRVIYGIPRNPEELERRGS
ncbi:MAG: tRNA pseudouridine(38-40) synthase TruA [Myxococcota bacterium]